MKFAKYFEIYKINAVNNINYLADFISNAVFIGLIIFIFINLWQTIYSTRTVIEGFTIQMMIWYLVMTESLVSSQFADRDISKSVISGDVVYILNKPYSFLIYHFAKSVSNFTIQFLLTFGISTLVAYLLIGGIKISLISIPFIVITVFLALIIDFILSAMIGVSAFWVEDTTAFRFIYGKLIFTIGGMLVPLEIFPQWLSSIADKLPFSFMAYHPAKLFVMFDFSNFIYIMIMQIFYIAILSLILYLMYRLAIKKVNIHGG